MSTAAQETTIKRWIETIAGLAPDNVFLGNGSGNRPNTDYVTFRYIGGGAATHSAKYVEVQEAPNEKFADEDFVSRENLTYQIDVFAEEGKDIINKLWLSRAVPTIRKDLLAGGITVSTKTGTRNLTALEDTDFAPRYSVDITFIGETNLSTQADLGFLNALWDKYLMEGLLESRLPVIIQSDE